LSTFDNKAAPKRNWGANRKLDGINLMPQILRSKKLLELEGLSGKKATNDLAARALFWRSGSYKAIIYSNWSEVLIYDNNEIAMYNIFYTQSMM